MADGSRDSDSDNTGQTLQERLSRQFYDWEACGRGWQLWEEPVELEPAFRPFFGHYDGGSVNIVDDGRKPTIFSSFVDGLRSLSNRNKKQTVAEPPEPEPESVFFFKDAGQLIEVQVSLPAEIKVSKDAALQFLLSLGHMSRPVSFELVGTHESITMQFACGRSDRGQLRQQLHAYFPDALITEPVSYLGDLWDERRTEGTFVVDFGLSHEFMRPLRLYERFDPDPLAGVIGAMAELSPNDVGLLQFLFIPVKNPWPESIMRAVTDNEGDPFFVDDPGITKLAAEKISSPLFAAVLRIAAQSVKRNQARRIAQGISKALHQFADPKSNELIPLSNDGYDDRQHSEDVLRRRSRRTGMLLNCDELVSLVHLPSASVRSVKLKRELRKTKAPPTLALGHQLVLGENHHAGKTIRVTLSPDQRVRHLHTIGASGSGKSTLLLNMIVQDVRNGNGLAVLDPHGDLIDHVLDRIPEERVADVVLLDPSDESYPVGFNILSAHSELERNLLASDLVSVFRRLSTTFGDQMNTVLGNAIMVFLESSEGGTLSDLRRFLVDSEYRQRFLQTVRDSEIVYYWRKEFPLLTGKPQGPILTRLDTFLRPKVIRHMVSQKADRLDFGAIMNGQKILLAKLSQGLIGEENSYLLGTLLVSKLNQMAMSRQNIAASERKHFYLYVDEFHNFVTPSMAAILAGARKYNLGLILAHQELHQLSNRDSDVASAVISNPYTRVCFRLGDFDAKKLEDGFSTFRAKDLQNLGVGEAICRIERAEYDFNLATVPLPPVDAEVATRIRERIVTSSRERYATRREEVEALLLASHSLQAETPAAERPRSPKTRAAVPVEVLASSATPETPSPTQAVQTPGRGGEHHKYLQNLIKKWAEARGFAVITEKPILDGLGWVDVALERGGRSIACEISVSTTAEHEIGNVQKCLAAGFEQVILISSEKKVLSAVKAACLGALSAEQYKQVRFLAPEQTFSFLEMVEAKPAARPVTPDPNELLTAKEVEELLRIDVKTVYSYVQRGILPYVKIQSNVRFIKSEILNWMAEQQFKPGGRGSRK